MSILNRLYDSARRTPRRVLLPESDDERIRAAAEICVVEGLAIPVFLEELPLRVSHDAGGADVEVFFGSAEAPRYRKMLELISSAAAQDAGIKVVPGQVLEPKQSLDLAAALLRVGYVDLVVAGARMTSPDVLRAGIRMIGIEPGAAIVSSAYLMELPQRAVTFADCAVVPRPTAEQLALIAAAAARFHERLTGEEARVAFLAYSTKGSAEDAVLEPIRSAVAALKIAQPEVLADGEMQFDCAFVPDIGRRKAPDSPVAGRANVFVFPDLNAANIACKIAIHIGKARAIGPFLTGIAKPWIDIPRGSEVREVVDTIVAASALLGSRDRPSNALQDQKDV